MDVDICLIMKGSIESIPDDLLEFRIEIQSEISSSLVGKNTNYSGYEPLR